MYFKADSCCFGTIRNNTALKPGGELDKMKRRFGTIRNNTALKHSPNGEGFSHSFGTIRNNTALKPGGELDKMKRRFGTIRNNTALKPQYHPLTSRLLFWNHSKQHSSKTYAWTHGRTPLVLEPFETTQL